MGQQPAPQGKQPDAQADRSDKPIAVLDNATLREIFEEAVKLYAREKSENAASEERKEWREKADLKAQQDMADWAYLAMWIAAGALFVNIGTIGLVWGTFWETHRTADAAIAAAKSAEDAIFEDEAPFLYPEITSENIWSQLSKLLLHDHPTSPRGLARPSVTFRIKNFGQSPAVLHSWRASVESFSAVPQSLVPGGERPPLQAIIEAGKAAEFDGDSLFATQIVGEAMGLEDVQKLVNGAANIWFYGEFHFAGTHGATYSQTFAMAYAWQERRFIPLRAEYNRRTRIRPKKVEPMPWWKRWFVK